MIVETRRREVLVDREALAMVTRRSAHTIRARCRIVRYRGGRPLYALEESVARLAEVPTRRRRNPVG